MASSVQPGCLRRCAIAAAAWIALIEPAAAQGGPPEDRYIAARDAAIARFAPDKAGPVDDSMLAEEGEARVGLETQVRALIGPVDLKDLGDGRLNLSTLFSGDQGFGTLDGLLFGEPEGKIHVIVTTPTLLARWLKAHRNWWKQEALPQQPAAAFRTEAFYTQAIDTDSAIVKFADVALSAPEPAAAMVAARTQSDVPSEADEVFVAAVRRGRAFIAYAALEPKLEVPACNAMRAEADRKATAAAEAAGDGAARDEAMSKKADALREKAEAEFKRCFAERAPREKGFAAAVALAKSLYERMAGR